MGDRPPQPPHEPSGRDWVCAGCGEAFHGKPEKVSEDPFECYCTECVEGDEQEVMADGSGKYDTGTKRFWGER